MTRENKLALVVGFGLILVVGILISDHFSKARDQQSARLGGVNDPLIGPASHENQYIVFDREIIQPRQLPPPRQPLANTGSIPAQNYGYQESAPVLQMPDLQNLHLNERTPRKPGVPPAASTSTTDSTGFFYHHVVKGEYLSTICDEYYGGTSIMDEIVRINGLKSADKVQVGQRLRLPEAGLVDKHRALSAPRSSSNDADGPRLTPKVKTYTVQSGDTLTEIAAKVMGSAKKWRKLYEHNQSKIDDPDNVPVGAVLRIPSQ